MPYRVSVAGRDLDVWGGGVPDLRWSLNENGSEACSWTGTQLVWMRTGMPVRVFDGPTVVWGGRLNVPGSDQVSASGYGPLLRDEPNLNSGDNVTTTVHGGVNGAISRGFPVSTAGTITTDDTIDDLEGDIPTVGDVWDKYEQQEWADRPTMVWVDPNGVVSFRRSTADGFDPNRAPDSSARWMIRLPAKVALTADLTNYASRLVVRFRRTSGTPRFDTVVVTCNDLAETEQRWGRVMADIDVSDDGKLKMTQARAIKMGRGALSRSRAKPGWAEALDVRYGDVTTLRGSPALLSAVLPGDTIRVMSEWDYSTELYGRAFADVRVARVEHADDGSCRIEPVGLRQGRRVEDIAASVMKQEKRRRRKNRK